MKTILFFIATAILASCGMHQTVLKIPPQQNAEIDFTEFGRYRVMLKNAARSAIEIGVVDKQENDTLRGFGLSPRGKVEVEVGRNAKLVLNNSTQAWIKVKLVPTEIASVVNDQGNSRSVNFTLRNETMAAIPLVIPGVMNPNLSPMSNSGVSLNLGQEIFFIHKKKRYVLLTVSEAIQPNQVVKVGALIRARKRALDLN